MISPLIREYLHAVPFRPFAIRLNDGRRHEGRHPDFAHVSPGGGRVIIHGDTDPEEVRGADLGVS